jgi:hypothetical protein
MPSWLQSFPITRLHGKFAFTAVQQLSFFLNCLLFPIPTVSVGPKALPIDFVHANLLGVCSSVPGTLKDLREWSNF